MSGCLSCDSASLVTPAVIGRPRLRDRNTGWPALVLGWLAALCCPGCAEPEPVPKPATPAPPQAVSAMPRQVLDDEFVSSETCRECHADQHSSWHASFHRTMTQPATPQAVVAPFENVRLKLDGRTFRLSRDGDEFWAELPDPDIESDLAARGVNLSERDVPTVRRRVLLTTGSHHLQHYWVGSQRDGGLFNLPWEFFIAEKRWIPMADTHIIPPDQPRNVTQWNVNCIRCHSVNGVPGLDRHKRQWSTRVAEFGIACEACHGPAARHVRHHRKTSPTDRPVKLTGPDSTIVNPARVSSKKSAEICGQCHSTFHVTNQAGRPDFEGFLADGLAYRAGDDLEKFVRVLSPHKPGTQPDRTLPFGSMYWNENDARGAFWPDGAVRVGGREFLGLLDTSCFIDGKLSCLSCHSMHESDPAGQIADRRDGNQACLQCHERIGKSVEAHTHHPAGSAGSLCYNCHMPHTSFALLRAIRSHRIDSPSAASSAASGRPNACNLCHLDQTLDWTARTLNTWYGTEKPKLAPLQREVAASVLWALGGDAAQRAVTAWHMGWEPAIKASSSLHWQPPFLATLFEDPYAVVRHVAWKSLSRFPGFENLEFDYIGPLSARRAMKQRVLSSWKQRSGSRVTEPVGPLLLEPGGRLQRPRFQDLLNSRDDRAVEILE